MNALIPEQNISIPIKTIFCIGRNYVAHIKELNHSQSDHPVVFLKPLSALVYHKESLLLPVDSQDVHHEVEVLLLIGKRAKNVEIKDALSHIKAYGIGIDFTARDIQKQAIKDGKPWTLAKGFDTFAAVSDFIPAEKIKNPQDLNFSLSVNNQVKQSSNTKLMIFPIDYLISYLSQKFTLNEGDLIYTGTPEGVGPVVAGDIIKAKLGDSLVSLELGVKGFS